MKNRKAKGRRDAVALHDGRTWRLLCGDGLRETSRPVASPADKLPQTLVDNAAGARCRSVRFLVSGDVHRMDGAIPSGMSLEKANAVIRASMAEATGVETDGLVVAGLSMAWGGVRKPFTLASGFGGDVVADFHAALAEAGIAFAGVASLELAMLSAWKAAMEGRGESPAGAGGSAGARRLRDSSFVIVGAGQSFVAPAPRGANPGPQTVPCGMRHFDSDPANWIVRFQRAAAGVGKESPLHVVALGGSSDGSVADALRDAGYVSVVEESVGEWMRLAANAALRAKPNRVQGVSVSVANPYEPRKRFSHGWIAAAALAVLALPAAFRMAGEWWAERECRDLAAAAAPFRPIERKIQKAKKSLAAAEAEFAGEQATQRARIGARRPLMAFIAVAQYFCKNAGESLTLDAIEQSGNMIEVRGAFSDPEDGVALNKGMLEYARTKNMDVVKNESANDAADGDASFASRFTLVLDCARVGEEAAK